MRMAQVAGKRVVRKKGTRIVDGHQVCLDCGEKKPLADYSLFQPRNGRAAVYSSRCKPCAAEKTRSARVQNRQAVLDAYGRRCVCCGETEEVFLALDHIENDGAEHRKLLNRGTNHGMDSVYRDVVRRGFPPEFQLLCHNCNMAKHLLGQCPHSASF